VTRSGAHPHAVPSPLVGLGILALLVIAGCSHGSSNLAGHWRGMRAEGVPANVTDPTNIYAAHMRFDVKGDVITVTTAKDTRTDHYKVISEDKTTTVINTDTDGALNPQTFTFPDATTMKWAVTPSSSVVFTKE
jgi:hypothetical protein